MTEQDTTERIEPVSFAELAAWRDRALAAEAKVARLSRDFRRLADMLPEDEGHAWAAEKTRADHARFMAAGWKAAARLYFALWTDEKAMRMHEFDEQQAERDRLRAVVEAARAAWRGCFEERHTMEDLIDALDALDEGGA